MAPLASVCICGLAAAMMLFKLELHLSEADLSLSSLSPSTLTSKFRSTKVKSAAAVMMAVEVEKGYAHANTHDTESANAVEVHNIERIPTEEIENYHGLTVQVLLVYLSLWVLCFGQLMNLVGAGAFARDIAVTVGGSDQTVWLAQVIAILTTCLGPIISQAADYWGRKWFLTISTGLGAVGCLVVSRATSMPMAIAGQVIVGPAYGAQALIYAVGSEILPRRWRPAAQAGLHMALSVGATIGLLAGSAMIRDYATGWRAYWYMTTAMFAFSAVIFGLLYNPPSHQLRQSLSTWEKLARLDWVAYALLTVGIVLFTIGLSWAKNPYEWSDPHVLVPFVVGLVFLLGLAAHQTWLKKDGLVHHDLFRKDRNFAIAMLGLATEDMMFFAANIYYPFQVSVVYGADAFSSGLHFSITFLASMAFSCVVAAYSSYTRRLREPVLAAFILFVLFYALMATSNLSRASATAMWAYPILLGASTAGCLPTLIAAAQLSAPPELIAITSGLLIAVRTLGASVALAVYQAIFASTISVNLPKDIAAAVLPLGLSVDLLPEFIGALSNRNQTALMSIPGVTPTIIGAGAQGLQQAYLSSFKDIWMAAAAFAAVAVIVSAFLINPAKDLNMHVDAPLDDK
ncbi:siderophore iron transporter [Cladophialophora carrionii]|uniref:Siderophore iron transporter n=1 Tax=Cladophialophora carrionii TaxID=86049 RepID=A0A1C1CP07_9EURO|nr:siderophore iron transporter [Cladophialophora carrionii]